MAGERRVSEDLERQRKIQIEDEEERDRNLFKDCLKTVEKLTERQKGGNGSVTKVRQNRGGKEAER